MSSTSPSSLLKTPSPTLYKVSPQDFKHIQPTRNPRKKTSKKHLEPLLFTPRSITNDHFTNTTIPSFHITTPDKSSASSTTTTNDNNDQSSSSSSLPHFPYPSQPISTFTISSSNIFSFTPQPPLTNPFLSFWRSLSSSISSISSHLPKPTSPEITTQLSHITPPYIPNTTFTSFKKVLIFDLDETLIHSQRDLSTCAKIVKVNVYNNNNNTNYMLLGINIRPCLKELFMQLKDKFHFVIFTSAFKKYADPIIDLIDPYGEIFCLRLYRHHCIQIMLHNEVCYIKDLRIFNGIVDLDNVVIVDNSIMSFCYQVDNGVPILPFYTNMNDREIIYLCEFMLKVYDDGCKWGIKEGIKRNIRKLYARHLNEMKGDNAYQTIQTAQNEYFALINAY